MTFNFHFFFPIVDFFIASVAFAISLYARKPKRVEPKIWDFWLSMDFCQLFGFSPQIDKNHLKIIQVSLQPFLYYNLKFITTKTH